MADEANDRHSKKTRLKWRLLGWAEKHPRYWHLEYPRAFKFVEWVIPPHNMGLRYWFRYVSQKGSREEHGE